VVRIDRIIINNDIFYEKGRRYWMVEFLEDVEGGDFKFETGKHYVSMESPTKELKDCILIRQPNSPKKKNWWCRFDKKSIDKIFKVIEGSWEEKTEENRLLQL
jgi:hypothetical protein